MGDEEGGKRHRAVLGGEAAGRTDVVLVGTVEALRQAQLSLLQGTAGSARRGDGSNAGASAPYSNPYYWAPFFLIGNWK